jgi:tripartite-type tricarboxylate transporter receptor subunit TctC
LTDITYLGRTAGLTFGLVVNSSSPIKTFEDYVKYAKANPGKLSYGSTGIGTSTHVYMEDMAEQLGIKLNHVPFKGGNDNLNALLGNHTDSMMDSSVWSAHVQSGKLRLLAVFTEKRILERCSLGIKIGRRVAYTHRLVDDSIVYNPTSF